MTFLDCCHLVTSNEDIVQSLGTVRAQVTEKVSPGIFLLLPAHHYLTGTSLKN